MVDETLSPSESESELQRNETKNDAFTNWQKER